MGGLLWIGLLLAPIQAWADEPTAVAPTAVVPTANSTADKDKWLPRINAALANMQALSGRFEQKLPNGGHAAGQYFIDWPQHLRFAYDVGSESVVTVRGKYVAVQDAPGGLPNWFPVSLTPLAVIRQAVAEGLSADMLAAVTDEDAVFSATLKDPSGDVPGEAMLFFAKGAKGAKGTKDARDDNDQAGPSGPNGDQLYAWRLVDAQNQVTLVRLREITRHKALDKSVFAIVENDESDDY